MTYIKIAYIGGGSKMWARVFMNDLALSQNIRGEISLYDIDNDASIRNQLIGNYINKIPGITKWNYIVSSKIEDCLANADFVILSILPGTFEEMMVDVHKPEEYGIYQTVGDTVGPGGVLRSMRTVPIYEEFAEKIKNICPHAWVINLTNPMSICVKTLYDVFDKIKAFGCCHEVFHAQEFLAMVVKEELNLPTRPNRKEIQIDVSGINHFTWISSAKYQDKEILSLVKNYSLKHFKEGIYEGDDPNKFKYNTFAYGNKVKMDMYRRYKVLGAAGDRHLVEFMNNNWYLKDLDMIKDWAISITPVSYRINDMHEKIEKSIKLSTGKEKVEVKKSNEELIPMMEALLGYQELITNVNYKNSGNVEYLPLGDIVESNCIFKENSIELIKANSISKDVENLIRRNCINIDVLYDGIKKRDFQIIFNAFMDQPLCSNLSLEQGKKLFKEMVIGTRKYLDQYYDIDAFIEEFR